MKILAPLAQQGRINDEAGIRDRQSIIINASPKKVWDILADVSNWNSWNPDVSVTQFTELKSGASCKITIGSLTTRSTFRKVEEPNVLSWTSQSQFTKSVIVWKLEAADDTQTIASLEESLQGILTVFQGHQKLHNIILNWLHQLKVRSEE